MVRFDQMGGNLPVWFALWASTAQVLALCAVTSQSNARVFFFEEF